MLRGMPPIQPVWSPWIPPLRQHPKSERAAATFSNHLLSVVDAAAEEFKTGGGLGWALEESHTGAASAYDGGCHLSSLNSSHVALSYALVSPRRVIPMRSHTRCDARFSGEVPA